MKLSPILAKAALRVSWHMSSISFGPGRAVWSPELCLSGSTVIPSSHGWTTSLDPTVTATISARSVCPTHWNLDLVLNTDPSKEAQAFLSTNAATLSSSSPPRGTECANLLKPPKDADRLPPPRISTRDSSYGRPHVGHLPARCREGA